MSTPSAVAFPELNDLPTIADLPDPLVSQAGRPVTTAGQWMTQRRPELLAMFQHYVYGPMPIARHPFQAVERHRNAHLFNGKATLSEVELQLGGEPSYRVRLLVVIPNGAKDAVPVFLGLNRNGNHTVTDDPGVALPESWMPEGEKSPSVVNHRATDAGRGSNVTGWPVEMIIDRGYAFATYYPGDIAPDRADYRPVMLPGDQGEPVATGTLAAWAWGAQRMIDYLETLPEIDRAKIAVMGHSRRGKTALLAAAFDERIALVIPHQAGCGGTAPSRSRNPAAETVARINRTFPHWFNDRFKTFGDCVEKLPLDQHALIALVAPRAILLPNAQEDQWANPPGQFDMLRAAAPVYRLLGVEADPGDTMPPLRKLLRAGPLGYYIREGGHTTDPDFWTVFMDFADEIFS